MQSKLGLFEDRQLTQPNGDEFLISTDEEEQQDILAGVAFLKQANGGKKKKKKKIDMKLSDK